MLKSAHLLFLNDKDNIYQKFQNQTLSCCNKNSKKKVFIRNSRQKLSNYNFIEITYL